MLKHVSVQIHVFFKLLQRDLTVFYYNIFDNYINTLSWVLLSLLVYQFIMPNMGLLYKGDFLLVSCVISKTFFGIMDNVTSLLADLDENKAITYDMTLPLSHTLLCIKIALSNAMYSFLLSFLVLPAGKILLWNSIQLPCFDPIKYTLILCASSLFSGFFSLYILGITQSVMQVEDVWNNLLFPMFFLGGFTFTWKVMFAISPFLAYLNLCNPVMYMFEGVRAATLEPSLSLPFWNCISMLIAFSCIAGYVGISLLKKRLDAI